MDTRSIIESSISGMRQDSSADGGPGEDTTTTDAGYDGPAGDDLPDTDTDGTPDERPVADPVADPAPEKPAEEAAVDEDDLSKIAEFETDRLGRKRENRIPHSRVKRMVDAATKKAEAAVREAVGKEYGEKLTASEQRIAEMEAIGEIMERDTDRFMSVLAEVNPAYRSWKKQDAAAEKPERTVTSGADDPMPTPDSQLADGTPSYSPEGFQKVLEWQARQIESRVEKKVTDRYKWVDDARAAQEMREAALPGIRAQIADATQNWDGFEEHFDAILTELRTDSEEAARTGKAPKLTLHDAYRRVIVGKHKEERERLKKENETLKIGRNKQREELMRELKAGPRSTAAVPTTHVPAKDADTGVTGDSKDIIRAAIAGIRNRASE